MTSEEIVERYGAKLKGQQRLWDDPDLVLRQTPFRPTGERRFDRDAIAWWWLNVYVPDGYGDEKTPYEVYKTWSAAVYECFRYVRLSGYWSETNQQAVQILGYRAEPPEAHTADLLVWLPHVREGRGRSDRPGKHLDVFEHTLSQYGTYTLTVNGDGSATLGIQAYGRWRELRAFGSAEAAVDHVRLNHWYEE